MKLLFGLFLAWTAFGSCAVQNDTEFSCCDLPLDFPTDCDHDYEMSVNGTSLVTVRRCQADAVAPFKAEGNAVTLEECVEGFVVVKTFSNTNSEDKEKTVCYRGKPCDPQTDHTGVGVGVGVLVLALVICVIVVIVNRPWTRAGGYAVGQHNIAT